MVLTVRFSTDDIICIYHLLQPMETDEAVLSYRPRSSKLVGGAILPELDIFVHLLVLLRLLDTNHLEKVEPQTGHLIRNYLSVPLHVYSLVPWPFTAYFCGFLYHS